MDTWSTMKNTWKDLKEQIDKESREIAENETSIMVLETNLGPSTHTDILKSTIHQKKELLQQKIQDFSEVQKQIENIRTDCIGTMKMYLDMYKDIQHTLGFSIQQSDDSSSLVVEMAKTLYPNTFDNLQLRPEPPIKGIEKVSKIPEPYCVADSNMDAFFKIHS